MAGKSQAVRRGNGRGGNYLDSVVDDLLAWVRCISFLTWMDMYIGSKGVDTYQLVVLLFAFARAGL